MKDVASLLYMFYENFILKIIEKNITCYFVPFVSNKIIYFYYNKCKHYYFKMRKVKIHIFMKEKIYVHINILHLLNIILTETANIQLIMNNFSHACGSNINYFYL